MNTLRTITTALLLVVAAACAVAQNSIDRMMDNYSSRGTSRFTSAVEREPKTRKVLKVVNVLELRHDGVGGGAFCRVRRGILRFLAGGQHQKKG